MNPAPGHWGCTGGTAQPPSSVTQEPFAQGRKHLSILRTGRSRSRQRMRAHPALSVERSWVQRHPGLGRGSGTARAPQPWHRRGLAGTAWGARFPNGISNSVARDSGDSGSAGALPSSWVLSGQHPTARTQHPTAKTQHPAIAPAPNTQDPAPNNSPSTRPGSPELVASELAAAPF